MGGDSGFADVLLNEVRGNIGFYQGLGLCSLTTILAARYYASSRNPQRATSYTEQRPVSVSELWLYPIKGCAGVRVPSLTLSNRGDLYDRQYIIIRDDLEKKDGTVKYITGRCTPKICLIHPKVGGVDGALVLSAEGHNDVIVPRKVANAQWYDLKPVKQRCVGRDCGDEVARWLQAVLGLPSLRLVRMHPFNKLTTHNESDPKRERSTFGDLISNFQDSYPFSVVSRGTIKQTAIDCKMSADEVILRFRPNIIIDSMQPWVEDRWVSLDRIGGDKYDTIPTVDSTSTIDTTSTSGGERTPRFDDKVLLKTFKPCPRCSVPSVNPYTADRNFDPESVLSAYRSGASLMQSPDTLWSHVYKKHRGSTFWSVLMAAHHDPSAKISVGDSYLALSQHL